MRFLDTVANDWHDLLLGGKATTIPWVRSGDASAVPFCLVTILLGTGAYGAAIGIWNGPEQALYVAVKLPLAILLTLGVNGLLNGLLAILLGVKLGFRQTTLALLAAFALFSLILASLSPIAFGMGFDAPPPDSPEGPVTHRRLILFHVVVIAFAGLVSTGRLLRVLEEHTVTRASARRGLAALIAGNLFAGAQICFLLRPIFGQPGLEIELLRPDAFDGNFYESVWWALRHSG